MKKGIGIFFLVIAFLPLIDLIINPVQDDAIGQVMGVIICSVIGFLLIFSAKKDKEKAKEFQNKRSIERKQIQDLKNEKLNAKMSKVDELKNQVEELQKIDVSSIDDFKKSVIENENNIVKKGGENQLYSFLKIATFLKDYRERILSDREELENLIDTTTIKNRIIQDSKRSDLEKLNENLQANLAKLEGGKAVGFDANLENIFKLGRLFKPTIESQIRTLEFYQNMSNAMLVFYINDKKIRYFEIYEAFEKLGVFDSTWQKSVLNKLDKIEVRLAQINNQLTKLNQNFLSLVESSETIVSELKEINSNITTNNMLQAITTYQTWKTNKNS